jgi:hypothetical protein
MKTWLVELTKQHTVSDLDAGAIGYRSVVNIFVRCDRPEEVRSIVISKGGYEVSTEAFSISRIEDWDLIQEMQIAENIRYLFNDQGRS